MSAFKNLERRVCNAFGGQRVGVSGRLGSDCSGVPFSIEIKRTKRRVPEGRHIAQAELQGKRERKPWILVTAGHNDRQPLATLPLSVLLSVLRQAGLVPEVAPSAGPETAASADELT